MPHKLVLWSLLFISFYANSQVGINTITPDEASILDIEATYKGLLIPRVNIQDLITIAPITGGDPESLLVYNTNATTGEGFYFWKDNRWNLLYSSDSDSEVWGLQYYSYKYTGTSPPNIDLSNVRNLIPVSIAGIPASGIYPYLTLSIPTVNHWSFNNSIIRIIGTYTVENSGTFYFSSNSNNGARIYIDDVRVLNSWYSGSGSGSVFLTEGKHKIEFWVYNDSGNFFYNFSWGANPDNNTGIIQASQFTIEY